MCMCNCAYLCVTCCKTGDQMVTCPDVSILNLLSLTWEEHPMCPNHIPSSQNHHHHHHQHHRNIQIFQTFPPQDAEMKKLRDEASSNLASIASSLRLLSVSLRFCQILRSTNHYEKVMMTIHSKIKLLYFLKIKNLGPFQKIFIALIVTSIRVHHNFIGC